MITSTQCAKLHRTLRGSTRGNGQSSPLADILTSLYAIACDLTDPDDIYNACDDLVDEATRARDEADAAIMTAHQDAAANRGDDRRDDLKWSTGHEI